MNIIDINTLEIFKTNKYFPTEIGMVSDNAYLSIIATNKCQCKCPYCINSETDHRLSLPIGKAIHNIKKLTDKYNIKEAIILGGEPLLHPNIIELVRELRHNSGLETIRLTTNGIKLNDEFIMNNLFDANNGIHGINISCHNQEFMPYARLSDLCKQIKTINENIKIRINTNIWRNNLDNLEDLLKHISIISAFADEMRISNIIPKDDFSVNNINHGNELILSNEEYENIFNQLLEYYSKDYTIFKNDKTLGFVKYLIIPTKKPIIVNWNINSEVAKQICENDIKNRQINTFKCLVSSDISLSWNNNNIITL